MSGSDERVTPPDFTRLAPRAGARIAVVGGCGGIGRALVEAMIATELRVAVLDLAQSLARHPPPAGAWTRAIDATDEAAVADAFAALARDRGGLDGLVNLAGFMTVRTPVADASPAWFDELVAGNLRSAYLCCRAALPLLHAAGGGAIVNVSSGLATRVLPGFSGYAAAKAGVIALTKAVAIENAPRIRANAVAPAAVDTAFLRGGTGRGGDEVGAAPHIELGLYARTIPLGRIALPEDVVGPILFLLGDAARYMTGQVLYVNGGAVMP